VSYSRKEAHEGLTKKNFGWASRIQEGRARLINPNTIIMTTTKTSLVRLLHCSQTMVEPWMAEK
jgi:hypothetical protein